MPTSTTPKPRLPSAIHRVVISTALSKAGDNFTEIALAVFVLGLTHSAAALGLVLAMAYLPKLLLGPILAGFVDRLPRRLTLLIADFMRAGLVVSIPVIHTLWWTIVASALIYSFALVYVPLLRSLYPVIAGSPETVRLVMIRQTRYMNVGDLIAYAAAGGLILWIGVGPAFGVDSATFLASGLILWSLRLAPEVWASVSRHTASSGWSASIREALTYIRQDRLVLFVVSLSGFLSLAVGSINTVLAPLSHDLWHVSSGHYAYLMLALAGGSLVTAHLIEKQGWQERLSPAVNVAVGAVLTGIGIGATLLAGNWIVGMGAMIVAGSGNPFYAASLSALVQNSTPDAIRARVLVLRTTLMGLGGALGAWGSGLLAHGFGIGIAVVVVTGLWIGLAVVTFGEGMMSSATPVIERMTPQ